MKLSEDKLWFYNIPVGCNGVYTDEAEGLSVAVVAAVAVDYRVNNRLTLDLL
jgi:hypothetical protein